MLSVSQFAMDHLNMCIRANKLYFDLNYFSRAATIYLLRQFTALFKQIRLQEIRAHFV